MKPTSIHYTNRTMMTPCQLRAYNILIENMNKNPLDPTRLPIFISGGGGTGKSYVLKKFKDYVVNVNKKIAVVATQAIAATLIDGKTIHSVFNIRGGNAQTPDQRCTLTSFPYDVLIIDEISMLNGELLDLIENTLVTVKRSAMPFGGVYVCVLGDLLQLPPVNKSPVYKANCWKWFRLISLVTNVRHKGDDEFSNIMARVRIGDRSAIDILNEKCLKTIPEIEHLRFEEGIITIVATNRQVQKINNAATKKFSDNGTLIKTIHSKDESTFMRSDTYTIGNIMYNHDDIDRIVPKSIDIFIGAIVMITANDINGNGRWCNGDTCKIVNITNGGIRLQMRINGELVFMEKQTYQFCDFTVTPPRSDMVCVVNRCGYPIQHGWATTIHKVQGSTHDKLIIDPSGLFSCGQLYVALSRVKACDGLCLMSRIHNEHLLISTEILQVYRNMIRYGINDDDGDDIYKRLSIELKKQNDKLQEENEELSMELAAERIQTDLLPLSCSQNIITNMGSCILCKQNYISCCCVPCGHMCFCIDCANKIILSSSEKQQCPYCKSPCMTIIKIKQMSN
ncbi:hypothetical protein [Trichoplusia ni ascovirus 2c]|uniref:hypothetical protein n=1 Tax=Trichoplusia ni ascovirus 2c TaxID=328615 RepID=UPI0000E4422A|nr:hypothetical protein TNAV2c_gp082 [Trichoplusia ni ascovirus 2c]ABF70599.1 hypothetical protein [Trichoplusia ni ascovirus 2c]AUS94187.1 helicase [Trichoplusia ni ascovirus 6b]